MKSVSLFRFCFVLLLLNQCLAKSFSNHENIFNTQRIKRNEPNDDENDDNEEQPEENVSEGEPIPEPDEDSDKKDDKPDVDESAEDDDIIISSDESSEVSQDGSKLMIILVDGFRWDYVSLDKSLKGFRKIAENGVRAKYVKPVFPTISYPNWYTIVTGLYTESHGMIGNYMYDEDRDDLFLMAPHPEHISQPLVESNGTPLDNRTEERN